MPNKLPHLHRPVILTDVRRQPLSSTNEEKRDKTRRCIRINFRPEARRPLLRGNVQDVKACMNLNGALV